MPKFPEVTLLWSSFLQNQTLTCSLENSFYKQVFLKNYREDPEKVFKKDCAIGVLLGSFQKISKKTFFRSTKRRLLPKIQAEKKSKTQTDASGQINRKLWSTCYERWVIVIRWYWCRITKHKKETWRKNFNKNWDSRLTKTFLVI